MASRFDITTFVERLNTLKITKSDWKKQLNDLETAWTENNVPLIKSAVSKIRSSIKGQCHQIPELVRGELEELAKGEKKPSSSLHRGLHKNETSANRERFNKTDQKDRPGSGQRESASAHVSGIKGRALEQENAKMTAQITEIVDSLQRLKEEAESGEFSPESSVKETETGSIISHIRNTLRERESQMKKQCDQHEEVFKQLMDIYTTLCIEDVDTPRTRRMNQNSPKAQPTILTIINDIKATLENKIEHISRNDLQTTSHGDIVKELSSFRSKLHHKWDDWCAQNEEQLCPQTRPTTSEQTNTHDKKALDIMKDIKFIVESQMGHMTHLAKKIKTTESARNHLEELTRAIEIQHSEVCSITEKHTTTAKQAEVSNKQTPVTMLADIKAYIGEQQAEMIRIEASKREMQKQVESAEKDIKEQNNQEKLYDRNAQLEKYKILLKQHSSEMKKVWLLLQPGDLQETLKSSESEKCKSTSIHKEICQRVNEIQDDIKTMYSTTQYEELKQNFDMYENSFRHMWNEIFEGDKFDPKTGVDNLLNEIRRLVVESKSSDENICVIPEHQRMKQQMDNWQKKLEKTWTAAHTTTTRSVAEQCPHEPGQLFKEILSTINQMHQRLKESYPMASFDEVNQQLQQCKEDTKQMWIVLHKKSSTETSNTTIGDIDSDAMSKANYERVTRLKKKLESMRTNVGDLQDKLKMAKDERELQLTRLQATEELLLQDVRELKERLKQADEERDGLLNRLSKVAGAKMTEGNANIADLSDQNRPQKLVEKYSELYDNEWTDAFGKLEAQGYKGKKAVTFLLDILFEAYSYCFEVSQQQNKHFRAVLLYPVKASKARKFKKSEQLDPVHVKMITDLKKQTSSASTLDLLSHFKPTKPQVVGIEVYINTCVELCWLMCIQSPRVYLDIHRNFEGATFDKNCLKPYTKSGEKVKFLVWPPLYIEKDGGMLMKGVAQGM